MARKDDRRIQKTRKQLRDSMLELILDRGYDDISIQDVTDRANLGRATFYLHYREKDELYADVIQNMAQDYFTSLPKLDPKKVHLFNVQHLKQLFNFVENHYDFYRIIIMGRGAMLTFVLLTDIAKEYILAVAKAYDPHYEEVSGIPSDFLLNFNANALISTIFWWLENGMPYSADEMAQMYEKVSFYTNYQILRSAKVLGQNQFSEIIKTIGEGLAREDLQEPKPVEDEPEQKKAQDEQKTLSEGDELTSDEADKAD